MLPQPDDPLVGRVLSGRYEIIAPLGSGGMGRVYRAIQHPLDRLVALKVLDPRFDRANDPEFEKRFLLEASVTAKLKHPNTITVHDYGRTHDGIYFIAMELVEGETLQQVLLKDGRLPWQRALTMGAQVARSLREAHKLGLVHRDLKPANIMLLPEEAGADAVKVLDFGLVKDFTLGSAQGEKRAELTQARMLIGSPLYVSPEQIRNQTDPRSDIYSLGIVLFQAIAGRTPFAGNDTFDIIAKHLREKPPQLRDLAAIPAEVNHLVMKCLEKAPEARFQNMDELLEAMRRATSGEGLSGVFRDTGLSSIGPSLFPTTATSNVPAEAAAGAKLERADPPAAEGAKLKRADPPDAGGAKLKRADPPDAGGAKPKRADPPDAGDSAERPVARPPGRSTRYRLLIAGAGLLAGVLSATAFLVFGEPEPPKPPKPAGAEAPPAPKNAAARAEVVFAITSEPPGATVLLGGKPAGVTPFNFALSPEGPDPLRLELGFSLDGYLDATRVVQGMEGAPVPVHQVMVKRPAPAPSPAPAPAPARALGPAAPATPPKIFRAPPPPPKKPNHPAGYKDDPY